MYLDFLVKIPIESGKITYRTKGETDYVYYAYNHLLFSNNMRIYSDSKVSDLLQSMTTETSVGFLNDWNATRDISLFIH